MAVDSRATAGSYIASQTVKKVIEILPHIMLPSALQKWSCGVKTILKEVGAFSLAYKKALGTRALFTATSPCKWSAAIQISRWRTRWVHLLILLLMFWCSSSIAAIVPVLHSFILHFYISTLIHLYVLGSFRCYGRCSVEFWGWRWNFEQKKEI